MLNIDCMEYMKTVPDKYFDLAIVDPPYFVGVANRNFYGSDISTTGVKRLCSQSNKWDSGIPDFKYFKELIRVSCDQIVWGCNYYPFDGMGVGRIVWDKKNDDSTFSNCELASITLIDSVKIFRFMWNGMLQENMKNKEDRFHPTQKPVALYKWLLKNYAKPEMKILDTHGGSFSSAIACYDFGTVEYVGCELDKDYFDAAVKRYNYHISQTNMFERTTEAVV